LLERRDAGVLGIDDAGVPGHDPMEQLAVVDLAEELPFEEIAESLAGVTGAMLDPLSCLVAACETVRRAL